MHTFLLKEESVSKVFLYEIGDRFSPYPKEVSVFDFTHKNTDYLDEVCHKVLLPDGTSGYIYFEDVKIFYFQNSDYVEIQQEKLLNIRWYKVLPTSFVKLSENFFEAFPFFMNYDFAPE